ncbi:MAG: RCC1 domain-containing protein [Steroidobacter sp.]
MRCAKPGRGVSSGLSLPGLLQNARAASIFVTAFLLCAGFSAAGAGEPTLDPRSGDFREFVVEGGVANAAQVEIRVFDQRGEQIDGAMFYVENDRIQGALPLPLDFAVDVLAEAQNADGRPVATAHQRVQFSDMRAGASELTFVTREQRRLGAVLISPIRLDLDSERLNDETVQYLLRGFDARGELVQIDPIDVSWSTPFPLPPGPGAFIPCKPSGAGPIPCIELNIPLRANPQIVACLVDVICRSNFGGSYSPPPVGYKAISAGNDHTCALTTEGRILCWGSNQFQQLGAISTETCQYPPPLQQFAPPCSTTPRALACPAGSPCEYLALDAGHRHTCAIDIRKDVWCWGNNEYEQLAYDSCPPQAASGCRSVMTPQYIPMPSIPGELHPRFVQISAGKFHTCGVTEGGNVLCWGNNTAYQSGGASHLSAPHLVVSQNQYSRVSAGEDHSCAVTRTGELECWGGNTRAQIHPGGTMFYSTPLNVRQFHPTLIGAVDFVAASVFNTCANSAQGGVACWGAARAADSTVLQAADTDLELGYVNIYQTGLADELCTLRNGEVYCGLSNAPLAKHSGTPVKTADVTVGAQHYCLVASDGAAQCWGDNLYGQLGNGTRMPTWLPARVLGP